MSSSSSRDSDLQSLPGEISLPDLERLQALPPLTAVGASIRSNDPTDVALALGLDVAALSHLAPPAGHGWNVRAHGVPPTQASTD